MDIKTLCLGILTMGDASGYEIKQVFEDAFSHFYVAGFGSIYPALADLTRDGHVTVSNIEQEKRPAKKVYRLTSSGHDVFNAALTETYPHHRLRSDFLVLMIFADLLSAEKISQIFDERLAEIQRKIDEIESCLNDENCKYETQPGAQFCGGYGLATLTAGKDYILQNRDKLILALQHQKEKNSENL
jgi:PadR family transcriptional regulator, regulatory protein AphA